MCNNTKSEFDLVFHFEKIPVTILRSSAFGIPFGPSVFLGNGRRGGTQLRDVHDLFRQTGEGTDIGGRLGFGFWGFEYFLGFLNIFLNIQNLS